MTLDVAFTQWLFPDQALGAVQLILDPHAAAAIDTCLRTDPAGCLSTVSDALLEPAQATTPAP